MISKKMNSVYKGTGCPYYDEEKNCWRVRFPDRDAEEGDLLYVASELARTGLYYPYNNKKTKEKTYSGHSHSFEGVIEALLNDPDWFSVSGFESYYSEQEIEFLKAVKEQLDHPPFLEVKPAKTE